ncbi:MAG: conserved rane protein of unknown function [Fibrobacteres bacterium]|nr:conserved rane protein of unknown function [Fibrobacterota bacterium]
MSGNFIQMLKHSSIYGVFNILSRVIGFLMIPVYTRFLSPSDYGTIELLDLTGYIAAMFIGLSLSSAITRFYYEYAEEGQRKLMASTSLLFVGAVAMAVCLALIPAGGLFARSLFGAAGNPVYFRIIFATLFFQALIEECLVLLQVRQQSLVYAVFSTLRLLLGLSLNILFVVHFKMGVYGILYSGLITSSLAGIYIYSKTLVGFGIGFSTAELGKLMKFGLPLFLAGFGPFILTFSDRYFLNHYAPLSEVGIYALAYKISMLISVLVTNPFITTWGPKRFEIAKKPDAKEFIARVFTYYCLVIFIFALGLSMMAGEILQIVAGPSFRSAARFIPILAVGYIFAGCYYHFNYGIFLMKKTFYATWIWAGGAVVNIILNYFLIRAYHGMGATLATSISFLFISVVTFTVSQRLYPIPFEFGRIAKLALAILPVYLAARLLPALHPVAAIAIKTGLLAMYPALLYATGFFRKDEIAGMALLLSKARDFRTLAAARFRAGAGK